MSVTLDHVPSRPRALGQAEAPVTGEVRRPFRDNPRLILLGILLLLVALVAMITLANRSTQLSPTFLSEVVLYALSAADLTMLVALAFVLARNVIKLVVERRRALPFARFRAKLVAVLLGMTLIPAVLVLIVGSELIRNSAERWFSAPIDDVLTSANRIASDYYHERELAVQGNAERIAASLSEVDLAGATLATVRRVIDPEVRERRVGMVEVYRVEPGQADRPLVVPLVDVALPVLSRGYARASADRLAARVAGGSEETRVLEPLPGGGELVRSAALVRRGGDAIVGVVIASDYLAGDLATHARLITQAYEGYNQVRVLRGPLEGVYLSFFLMVTLMILVSATWMGLYLAKRITRPVQLLAAGAREIGAGRLDHRIEPETVDEFGSLVDAFNTMAAELSASQRTLERSRVDLERQHIEVEGRRRYIETILERIATGVVSIDAAGRITTINPAAARLLQLGSTDVGQPVAQVFGRPDLEPIAGMLRRVHDGTPADAAQEVALARDGREVHLAAAATTLIAEDGGSEGTVLVFDDVTPLFRAQRVAAWRDVARRLAHEIKNPLTPIQLSAERMRRQFASADEPARALVEECTETIVGEVDSLKGLVDEFAQFARMPAPRTVPTDLHRVLDETLALYAGLFRSITIEREFAARLPRVRVDPEQLKRVVINLVDNAVEALDGQSSNGGRPDGGRITVGTEHDVTNGVARITIADNGPGIPDADREKLFMPYYSTKRRGSGLGLAIVRRIIAEHGGSIEVGRNEPSGTRFAIDLPV
jgi:two-component system nitrogen regulation sensor histidine kinase NtrY